MSKIMLLPNIIVYLKIQTTSNRKIKNPLGNNISHKTQLFQILFVMEIHSIILEEKYKENESIIYNKEFAYYSTSNFIKKAIQTSYYYHIKWKSRNKKI